MRCPASSLADHARAAVRTMPSKAAEVQIRCCVPVNWEGSRGGVKDGQSGSVLACRASPAAAETLAIATSRGAAAGATEIVTSPPQARVSSRAIGKPSPSPAGPVSVRRARPMKWLEYELALLVGHSGSAVSNLDPSGCTHDRDRRSSGEYRNAFSSSARALAPDPACRRRRGSVRASP